MAQGSHRSLQQRFRMIALAAALLTVAAVSVVVTFSNRMRMDLTEESQAIRQEQRIADGVISGVMRQLVTVSSVIERGDTSFRAAFDAAGRDVVEGVQTYLFRDLSPEQRLQIERVKEEHRRVEVSALRTARFQAAGDRVAAAAARQETLEHGLSLLEALDGFLRLRELDLERLERRQVATFYWFWIGSSGLAVLVGGLLMVLVGRFLRGHVVQPLDELLAATAQVGGGDFTTRVSVTHDREFHLLAASFNRMAEQLAIAQQSLASRNADLERALVQVREAQAELVQSEKLGAVGRMTAGLAHELNNPLASVVGFSELLAAEARERPSLSAEAAGTYLEPIVREATRARLLIRSLLQFARRAGAEFGPVSLSDALEVAVGLQRHAFAQAGMRLVLEPPPSIFVVGELQQLQSVFTNIISNALDAMRAQGPGTLRVTATRNGTGLVRVEFEDDGPGLRHPDRVFEPFYTTKEVGQGTGLGLSLAQQFVEAFGGRILARNRPEGGAQVTVELREAEPDLATPVAPVREVPALRLAADHERRRVLVVEDEPYLQRLSAMLLERLGVIPLVVGSAAEARRLVEAGGVDAIISDVKLPGESGIEFYHWVEQAHPGLAARFLFVTGDVDTPELSALAAERPRSMILKPFAVAEYLQRVQEVLADEER